MLQSANPGCWPVPPEPLPVEDPPPVVDAAPVADAAPEVEEPVVELLAAKEPTVVTPAPVADPFEEVEPDPPELDVALEHSQEPSVPSTPHAWAPERPSVQTHPTLAPGMHRLFGWAEHAVSKSTAFHPSQRRYSKSHPQRCQARLADAGSEINHLLAALRAASKVGPKDLTTAMHFGGQRGISKATTSWSKRCRCWRAVNHSET